MKYKMSANRTQSSPIFVPDSLKFYVNRLSFSKNRVRLQALSTTEVGPNGQVIVRLPSNTMVNLASLTMTGSVGAFIPSAADHEGVALPTNHDFAFIETLSLIANGGIITQPFTNYKLLGTTLNDIYGSNSKVMSRNALQGSYPSPLIEQKVKEGTAGANRDACYQPFSINNWISATQTMTPSYISTNLLGDLELRLTMAGTEILATGDTRNGNAVSGLQARATWRMKNINFYIETASVQSSFLEQAIASKLAAGEPINVPFENIFSFTQSNEGASFNQRMSVSSQSVNKILAITQLDSDLSGVGRTGANDGDTAPQQKIINGIPQALRRNYNQAGQAQFSVNNQYSPNYQIDSQLTTSVDLVGGNSIIGGVPNDTSVVAGVYNLGYYNDKPPVYQVRNRTFSNALVETRAAMDIPDYDYDQADMLTNPTQMPFEYFGAPKNRMQPGSNGLMLSPVVSAEVVTNPTFDLPQLVRVESIGATNLDGAGWNGIGAPGIQTVGQIFEMTNASDVAAATPTVKPISPPAPKRASQYWFPYSYQDGLSHYLNDKYVLATSFDLDTCDKDRLVSGINTLGSNAQMFLNVVAAPNAGNNTTGGNLKNKSTVFVMCTSMVQIYQGATLKIIQ
jgi:hypothetical protein